MASETAGWPTDSQRLLLAVVLSDPEQARSAWAALEPTFDLDSLESGSFQLLPMLAERLEALGVDFPSMARLRGIRRRAWYRAHLAAQEYAELLRALRCSQVRALSLDGIGLSASLYGALTRRPLTGTELLVAGRPDHVPEVLADLGWRTRQRLGRWRLAGGRPLRALSPTGLSYVFRTHAPPDASAEGGATSLWRHAEVVDVGGVAHPVLSRADALHYLTQPRKRAAADRRCLWVVDVTHALGVATATQALGVATAPSTAVRSPRSAW